MEECRTYFMVTVLQIENTKVRYITYEYYSYHTMLYIIKIVKILEYVTDKNTLFT